MKSATRFWFFCAALVAAFGAGTARSAIAQDSGFFNGKTVTLVVGYSAGGGYDQYTRLLARHIGRYIPGNPHVLVQNMPGALPVHDCA
jgi:tripartite-type tricarboxylate transporter receptor subunit TctC